MNTRSILTLLALSTLSPQLSSAQGSLTPPAGPPVASMKTLDQVEARTPLVAGAAGVAIDAAGTITISQRGSYYLTGNRTITTAAAHGIVIAANGVNLDLNGFSLICTTVIGGHAIALNGTSGGRIHNGSVLGGTTVSGATFTQVGWERGVYAHPGSSTNHVSDLTVQGVRFIGIGMNTNFGVNTVARCTVDVCAGDGIFAQAVTDCTVTNAGGSGIAVSSGPGEGASVSNSFGQSVGTTGSGISAGRCAASNCKGVAAGGTGLAAAAANNCVGTSSSGTGLSAHIATNCVGESSSGTAGISVTGTASFCHGTRTGGNAITAAIAVACTSGGGTITGNKQLGTP